MSEAVEGNKEENKPPPTLVVLAAGMGARYGGLKQMDPVGPQGETILDYSVYDAVRAGFGKLVLVIRPEMEVSFRERIGAKFASQVATEYVFQELDRLPHGFGTPVGRRKPWGTAHALLMTREAVHEPLAVINADDFYGAEGYRSLAHYLQDDKSAGSYAMVGFKLRNTLSTHGAVARGVCRVSQDHWLEEVVELTRIEPDGEGARDTDAKGNIRELSGEETVSMNMWGFRPDVFGLLCEYFELFLNEHGSELESEFYLPTLLNELVLTGRARVKVLQSKDRWFGMTYREDHPSVVENIRQLIREGSYPGRLWP